MSDSSARSLFLALIGELDRCGARYLLVRNHEGYPDRFTGDVDIYLELDKIRSQLGAIAHTCAGTDWRLLRTVDRPWVIVLQFIRIDRSPRRSVFVVELFDRFTWLTFPYTSFDAIWGRRRVERGLNVLDQEVGAIISFAHYLFWAGFLPEKYQNEARLLLQRPDHATLLEATLGSWLAARMGPWLRTYAGDGVAWETKANTPERILSAPGRLDVRAQLWVMTRRARSAPLATMFDLLRIFALKMGELINVRGMALLVREDPWPFLVEVKKYHLYKNRNSIVLPAPVTAPQFVGVFVRAYWAMSRGGLCIIGGSGAASAWTHLLERLFGRRIRRVATAPGAPDALIDRVIAAVI